MDELISLSVKAILFVIAYLLAVAFGVLVFVVFFIEEWKERRHRSVRCAHEQLKELT